MRRYSEPRKSRGTVIPHSMRLAVLSRDGKATGGCVGFGRLPGDCLGGLEPDHVRASHGIGMKSVTCPCNLVSTCSGHHRYKTEHGKEARPVFLDYLATFGYSEHVDGHLTAVTA